MTTPMGDDFATLGVASDGFPRGLRDASYPDYHIRFLSSRLLLRVGTNLHYSVTLTAYETLLHIFLPRIPGGIDHRLGSDLTNIRVAS